MSRKQRPGPLRLDVTKTETGKMPEVSQPSIVAHAQELFKKPEVAAGAKEIFDPKMKVSIENAPRIIMIDAALEKYGRDVKVSKKPKGVTDGFLIEGKSGKFFIKNFLEPEVTGGAGLAELFVYRVLAELNLGPQVEGIVDEKGQVACMASKDIATGAKAIKTGFEAIEYLEKLKKDSVAEKTEKEKEHLKKLEKDSAKPYIIALEIMAKILSLGDVKRNIDNLGIVINESGEVRPMILDFHFSPTVDEVLGKSGSAIQFENLKKRLAEAKHPGTSIALTKVFESEGLEEEVYDKALAEISSEKLAAAIANAKKYCSEFFAKLSDPELCEQYSLGDLQDYLASVNENIAKLYPSKSDPQKPGLKRRNSSSSILEFLRNNDTASPLDFDPEKSNSNTLS